MFAVIKTGGKQYQVEVGSKLQVEKLAANLGDTINFDEVLLIADGDKVQVGKPTVEKASVKAKVLSEDKAKKAIIFKKLRRHSKLLKKGHRQELTRVEVTEINN